MSVPNQPGPQPSPPAGNSVVLAVLLAVGLMAGLCCAGMCGGVAFFFYSRADAVRIVQARPQPVVAQPSLPPDVMDWIVRSQLSRAYTRSLDAVTSNQDVIASLGDAVDTTNDPNALFRRINAGQLQEEETIEFEIEGQRGAAVVSALCVQTQIAPSAMPGMAGGYEPKTITVTLKGGTQINVPPPMAETPQGDR